MKTEEREVSVTLNLALQQWHRKLLSLMVRTLMVGQLDLIFPAGESRVSGEEVALSVAVVVVADSEIATEVVVVDSEADVALETVMAEEVDSEVAALAIGIVETALETETASEAVEETVVGSENLTESRSN